MDVSVCITTYKHEKYIKECLESIFAQEFSGTYEIIVCNDNSPDNTEVIINEIIASHPKGSKIKYFKNVPNLGYVKNTLFSFSKALGKYISVLDGDDYFIDQQKLQKQFDFLENNSDFSAAAGDSLVIYEDLDIPSHSFSQHKGRELTKENMTDLKIAQTSTLFFRKDILKEDFPTEIISADRCLYLLAGCYGKMKVFEAQLSSYRQFKDSISKKTTYESMSKDFVIIPFIKKYNPNYDILKLKAYFYYTLMSYSRGISKLRFFKAAFAYFVYNFLSKFTLNPKKVYLIFKWSLHTIRNVYKREVTSLQKQS
ncbi:glycosyltransferase family 2 protein [Chryseobacterium sp. C3]|jgi:glycosyltransferase involved in cell wall biosynthesis|uniref:glycosyltransferase family 2 protein n=1 Tax=Chryseobacterium sp. C3 TaxID=2761532 RepID=UPI00162A153E|nr:glycosyltransferase [Chryseobacterium sp. C3]